MKNRIAVIVTVIFSIICNFSLAQISYNETRYRSFYDAMPGKHSVKTIRLSTGVQLEYAEQGDMSGIPVIFLHGLSDSWHSFETTLPLLPGNIHAFAITQRGHGNSSKPENGYSPANFAADVAAFIREKKLGSVFIAGHSMGGVHAQQIALNYPQLIKGLVIIDSDPAFRDNKGMPEFYEEVLKLDDDVIEREFMDEFQKSTLAKPIDSLYYDLLVNEGLKVPPGVFKAALKGIMEVDFSGQLENINAPVLIFWGERDSFCGRDDQDRLVKGIKNARLVVYEGTGHALHWEETKRFADDLTVFINKVTKINL
ncbi:MAG TPA: alpha/beta hydrolase [Chitinophagaceae bacterium]